MKYCHNNSCTSREQCACTDPELDQMDVFFGKGYTAQDCKDFVADEDLDDEVMKTKGDDKNDENNK